VNLKQGHYEISMAFMRKLGYYEIGKFLLALQLGHDESASSFIGKSRHFELLQGRFPRHF
jgi:hypothetical protein